MQAPLILAIVVVALALTSPLSATTEVLKSDAVVIDKEIDGNIDVVKSYLRPRLTDNRAKIWVFFTDKNVFTREEFDRAAAAVVLTERARSRRAKMGREAVTFADLPVHRGYIERLVAMGGKFRRVSRWLNAASFEIPFAAIDAVNELPFVAKIRPVAAYNTEKEIISEPPENPLKAGRQPSLLNYGISFGQLDQINVPPVHDKGINGAGVIVAMFDTGYRKDHEAFAAAFATGRVLAEYDFIFDDTQTQNEPEDASGQHNHGTFTWSTLGGQSDGRLYGPAYGASFILAKTEDIRSETPVEEDNWAAAVEWADSIGAEVISSSLSYSDWYTYSNYDGQTAVTTIAANLATAYGIVVCNSMGNSGPGSGTLSAPADALEILSCGAVTSSGDIASFSSRGPTFDGRTKPEVCAQGVSTYCASAASPTAYAYVNGTSLSTPLIAGCAAALLSARPSLTPQMVRLALMHTASLAHAPDNTYGWGIASLAEALDWGARIGADVRMGSAPLTVSFADSSYVPASDWTWSFGDGDTSPDQNPVHIYEVPGAYDVSITITSDGRLLTDSVPNFIIVLADTITYASDTVYAGQQAVVDIDLTNSQELQSFIIPFDFTEGMSLSLDSFSVSGTRADGFTDIQVAANSLGDHLAVRVQNAGTPLPPGSGPVLRFYLQTDPYAFGNMTALLDTTAIGGKFLTMDAGDFDYMPVVYTGEVAIRDVARGDANNDGIINVGDPVYLINHIFKNGPAPITIESGDANLDFTFDMGDAVFLVNFIFRNGRAPNDI